MGDYILVRRVELATLTQSVRELLARIKSRQFADEVVEAQCLTLYQECCFHFGTVRDI